MLLKQRNDGYTEAVHHFPMPAPTGSGEVTFPSLLFQRATALDGLIDAHEAGLAVSRRVLDDEAMTILQAKHRSMDGGWSYIPEMALLPPDSDDLGIVLQVLHRIGGTQLASACDEPVRLALDAAEPSGAVPTWVFGPRWRSPGDQPARAYLEAIGRPGEGSQPEVVANFCYGLVVHDPARYCIPLECAAAYLESIQAEDGHWESAWYAGRYYGTYRTVNVLGVIQPESRAIPRARSFLLRQQRLDGGWGEEHSDALNTAFAVLTLTSCGVRPPQRAIARGVDYLLATQQNDGGWPAVTWGAFSTPYGPQAYGSRTITTAFALKALLAAGQPSGTTRSAVPAGDWDE